jgi:succinate-semialdehyde dehydrogenase/glutarate-semialdehyde dehydrogenase
MAQQQKAQTKSKSSKAPEGLRSFNPATGETLGEVRANSPGEIAGIVENARKVAPEWAAIPAQGRAHILRQVRYKIYEHLDDIVESVSTECGKPKTEALAHDVMPSILTLLYYERNAARALRPEKPARTLRFPAVLGPLTGIGSTVELRPFGVVGCISPWNYPFFLAVMGFAPALFAGNTVVIKPSEITPSVGERIREVLEPLPAGVATVIQGAGEVGAALVDAPCDKIAFIGSPGTGRRIAEAAAKHLTPVVMELGGQDSAIVCSDADLDIASSGVLWGSFLNDGQTCAAIERAYVVDSVADDFERQLVEKFNRLMKESPEDIGALTVQRQFDTVKGHVDDAIDQGAKVLATGRGNNDATGNGALLYPATIIEGRSEEMRIFKEETFGPLLPVVRVRDEDEAVRRANDDGFNLTASVWTTNRKKANAIASRIKAGTVAINAHAETAAAPWTPWGGIGESGYGRLNGIEGLREFTVPTHIARNLNPKMKRLWWYPYDEASEATIASFAKVLAAPKMGDKVEGFKTLLKNGRNALKGKL